LGVWMDYSVELKKIKFYRMRSLIVTVSYLPYGVFVFLISQRLNFSDRLMLTLISLYFVFVFYYGLKWSTAKCPRCHELFFGFSLFQNRFAEKCVNCGLEMELGKKESNA
jgi:hypothetical protein